MITTPSASELSPCCSSADPATSDSPRQLSPWSDPAPSKLPFDSRLLRLLGGGTYSLSLFWSESDPRTSFSLRKERERGMRLKIRQGKNLGQRMFSFTEHICGCGNTIQASTMLAGMLHLYASPNPSMPYSVQGLFFSSRPVPSRPVPSRPVPTLPPGNQRGGGLAGEREGGPFGRLERMPGSYAAVKNENVCLS
jgi:hypothetical protein